MRKPDPSLHNPSSEYLRGLIEKTGLSQRKTALAIGISERSIRDYLNPNHPSQAPYPIQFTLECLVIFIEKEEAP